MSRDSRLTPFSYVILALVGRNGAGPHDIVRMMREGAVFWTTSASHVYAEPKRLAKLGYLTAEKKPGRTHERTHYELTDKGRNALASWLAEPAPLPRLQNEAAAKLLGADFSDDATILASLSTLRAQLDERYEDLEEMERRAKEIPHRTRYLRLLNELARRTLDTQREWLEHVEEELRTPSGREAGSRPFALAKREKQHRT
jgi:PadR family transcriptional regulator, regulatory protein AphA